MRKTLSLLLALAVSTVLPAQTLQLQKGDHIAFVGTDPAGMAAHFKGKGVPFRTSHEIVGALVRKLIVEQRPAWREGTMSMPILESKSCFKPTNPVTGG